MKQVAGHPCSPPLQTTDKKVNEVTPRLFQLAPDAGAMAALEVREGPPG